MLEKMPKWEELGPIWWHRHGDKMKVKILDIQNRFLKIGGSAAELTITHTPDGWLVKWKINHSIDTSFLGKTLFSSEDIARAFDLINLIFPEYNSGEWLIERFGGTVAKQSRFIRYKDYLNIPGPGTGHDGDPNISIRLNQEIKDALRNLVSPIEVLAEAILIQIQ